MNLFNRFWRKPVCKRIQCKIILLDLAYLKHAPLMEYARLANLDLSDFTDQEIDSLFFKLKLIQGDQYRMNVARRLPRVIQSSQLKRH